VGALAGSNARPSHLGIAFEPATRPAAFSGIEDAKSVPRLVDWRRDDHETRGAGRQGRFGTKGWSVQSGSLGHVRGHPSPRQDGSAVSAIPRVLAPPESLRLTGAQAGSRLALGASRGIPLRTPVLASDDSVALGRHGCRAHARPAGQTGSPHDLWKSMVAAPLVFSVRGFVQYFLTCRGPRRRFCARRRGAGCRSGWQSRR
jgi:hypothetical protein